MIRQRGNSLEVIVYRGRNPATGKSRKVSRTVRGTDRDAHLRARQVELDLTAEVIDERTPSDVARLTVADLIDRYIDFARIEESTREQDRLRLAKHVRPALGDVRLSRLRADDLDELYRTLERATRKRKKLAPATVRRLHATIRSMLAQAVKWGWIATNPAENASPPSVEYVEPDAPPTEALRAFLEYLVADDEDGNPREPELAMFVRLDAVTGMRRAEVCALRRSDLNLTAGTVKKQRSLGMAKGAPYVKNVKNRVRGGLALDEETVAQLTLHLKAQDSICSTIGPDAYLFSLRADCSVPMRPDYVSKRVRARRVAVPGAERVTLRALRHWMATEGVEIGSVKAVGERGGWARTSTLTDIYAAHIPPSDLALARGLAARLDGPEES